MKKINKSNLVDLVAERALLSKRDAREAIEATFEIIEENLLENVEVNITNFGIFTPITKKGRIGTNPKSHELLEIKPKKTIQFRTSVTLKEKLK